MGSYSQGSFWDHLVEAFAGVHDTLNRPWFYDGMGNIRVGGFFNSAGIGGSIGNAINFLDVFIAAPVVAGSVVQPYGAAFMPLRQAPDGP